MAITAAMVKELREMTGAGMMDLGSGAGFPAVFVGAS